MESSFLLHGFYTYISTLNGQLFGTGICWDNVFLYGFLWPDRTSLIFRQLCQNYEKLKSEKRESDMVSYWCLLILRPDKFRSFTILFIAWFLILFVLFITPICVGLCILLALCFNPRKLVVCRPVLLALGWNIILRTCLSWGFVIVVTTFSWRLIS